MKNIVVSNDTAVALNYLLRQASIKATLTQHDVQGNINVQVSDEDAAAVWVLMGNWQRWVTEAYVAFKPDSQKMAVATVEATRPGLLRACSLTYVSEQSTAKLIPPLDRTYEELVEMVEQTEAKLTQQPVPFNFFNAYVVPPAFHVHAWPTCRKIKKNPGLHVALMVSDLAFQDLERLVLMELSVDYHEFIKTAPLQFHSSSHEFTRRWKGISDPTPRQVQIVREEGFDTIHHVNNPNGVLTMLPVMIYVADNRPEQHLFTVQSLRLIFLKLIEAHINQLQAFEGYDCRIHAAKMQHMLNELQAFGAVSSFETSLRPTMETLDMVLHIRSLAEPVRLKINLRRQLIQWCDADVDPLIAMLAIYPDLHEAARKWLNWRPTPK